MDRILPLHGCVVSLSELHTVIKVQALGIGQPQSVARAAFARHVHYPRWLNFSANQVLGFIHAQSQ